VLGFLLQGMLYRRGVGHRREASQADRINAAAITVTVSKGLGTNYTHKFQNAPWNFGSARFKF
jgi:hypothetical protein